MLICGVILRFKHLQHLPNFGKFREQKQKLIQEKLTKIDLLDTSSVEFATRPGNEAKKIYTVQDVIGLALNEIGSYNELDNKQQKVALIDDVRYLLLIVKN